MPNRAPRAVQKYLDVARKYGPDCILETAFDDDDMSDEDYYDLEARMNTWLQKWRWTPKKGWERKADPKPVICEGCGEEIPLDQMSVGGRKRRYHDNNNKCKQLAYRKRRQRERANA